MHDPEDDLVKPPEEPPDDLAPQFSPAPWAPFLAPVPFLASKASQASEEWHRAVFVIVALVIIAVTLAGLIRLVA